MVDRSREREDDATTLLAQGQAGFWLSESLILALVEAGVLDKDRIIEAIDIVIASKQAAAAEMPHPEIERAAVALLSSVGVSIAAAKATETAPTGKPGRRRKAV